ncbi:hypothetical protein BDV12DRAFT_194760 [Aspergillus spectabilis]
MSTSQTQFHTSSFAPSVQMPNPAGEGPIHPSQGWGQKNGAGGTNHRRQGVHPCYTGRQVKWNASAPANTSWRRQRGRGPRGQHANLPPIFHGNNPGQPNTFHGHPGQNQSHFPRSNLNRSPHFHNGAEQPHQGRNQTSPNQQYICNTNINKNHNNNNNNRNRNNENRRSKQGIYDRNNPRPVVRTGLDYDGDSIMTGMPFIYTKKQWTQIQLARHERDPQERLRQLLEQHFDEILLEPLPQKQPTWDPDTQMIDAPPSSPMWASIENPMSGASD